jgi:hypothetical protein
MSSFENHNETFEQDNFFKLKILSKLRSYYNRASMAVAYKSYNQMNGHRLIDRLNLPNKQINN